MKSRSLDSWAVSYVAALVQCVAHYRRAHNRALISLASEISAASPVRRRVTGCTFESGKGGHLIVRLGDWKSVLPMHGSSKELGTGLVNKIKKDLGLK